MDNDDTFAKVPWTEEQVRNLNAYQDCGFVHPYTCGSDDCRDILEATEQGWVCSSCGYKQDWAHRSHADHPMPNPFKEKLERQK